MPLMYSMITELKFAIASVTRGIIPAIKAKQPTMIISVIPRGIKEIIAKGTLIVMR